MTDAMELVNELNSNDDNEYYEMTNCFVFYYANTSEYVIQYKLGLGNLSSGTELTEEEYNELECDSDSVVFFDEENRSWEVYENWHEAHENGRY